MSALQVIEYAGTNCYERCRDTNRWLACRAAVTGYVNTCFLLVFRGLNRFREN